MSKFAKNVPLRSRLGLSDVVALSHSTHIELIRRARSQRGRSGTTSLDAPARDTCLRFIRERAITPAHRKKFLRSASQVMRAAIVDYRCERKVLRRDGFAAMCLLTIIIEGLVFGEDAVGSRNAAFKVWKEIGARSRHVVEKGYFGEMAEDEISDPLDVSVAPVKRDWREACALLFNTIGKPVP